MRHHPEPTTEPAQLEPHHDEWFVHHERVTRFIHQARELCANESDDVDRLLETLETPFRALLADQTWLPASLAAGCESVGMGGGIGQWLLFRSADGSLTLFSLVVPAGSATPVHDHHAWGLVGLFRGEQEEDVYERLTPTPDANGHAPLVLSQTRTVRPGDTYRLRPPVDDVHAVRTVSSEPSVSIHLLGIDAGCVWRHRFDPERDLAQTFRSGYTNQPCNDDAPPPKRIECG